jgi:hypothetical protein
MRPIGAPALKARSGFSLAGGCATTAAEWSERAEVAREVADAEAQLEAEPDYIVIARQLPVRQ